LGVTVRQIEVWLFCSDLLRLPDDYSHTLLAAQFIDDASISSPSRPIYAMLISREVETKQTELDDDGMTPEERQQIKAEKEAAHIRKQVEADLGGFDIEQEWVEEIEREECFEIDKRLGLAPPMKSRKFEVWLVDSASNWAILDKYELEEEEHGTSLKVLYLTDVIEDSDEIPRKSLFIAVGTGVIEFDGEDLASKGKLMLFQAKKIKTKAKAAKYPPLELVKRSEKEIAIGPVTYLASLQSEDMFRVVVGAGAEVTVEQWGSNKLTQVGFYHAHMQVLQITIFKTFFLLSDA
jgi:cleavage and polyadenylation specificity factor subunit 1